MSWKRLGNAWLNKNKKANPQNNLPMFTADMKITEDILAGDTINLALWRKIIHCLSCFLGTTHAASFVVFKP